MPQLFTGSILAVLALSLGLAACDDEVPSTVGEVCQADYHCAKGLKCSTRGKCYRPVDCKRLGQRLTRCQSELVFLYAPGARSLKPSKKAKVLADIARDMQTEVIEECGLSVEKYLSRYGVKTKKAKSPGQDRNAVGFAKCLSKPGCHKFSTCILELSKLRGAKLKGRIPVFPLPKLRFIPPKKAPTPVPMLPGMGAMTPGEKPGSMTKRAPFGPPMTRTRSMPRGM